jgi:hypothetical protein
MNHFKVYDVTRVENNFFIFIFFSMWNHLYVQVLIFCIVLLYFLCLRQSFLFMHEACWYYKTKTEWNKILNLSVVQINLKNTALPNKLRKCHLEVFCQVTFMLLITGIPVFSFSINSGFVEKKISITFIVTEF